MGDSKSQSKKRKPSEPTLTPDQEFDPGATIPSTLDISEDPVTLNYDLSSFGLTKTVREDTASQEAPQNAEHQTLDASEIDDTSTKRISSRKQDKSTAGNENIPLSEFEEGFDSFMEDNTELVETDAKDIVQTVQKALPQECSGLISQGQTKPGQLLVDGANDFSASSQAQGAIQTESESDPVVPVSLVGSMGEFTAMLEGRSDSEANYEGNVLPPTNSVNVPVQRLDSEFIIPHSEQSASLPDTSLSSEESRSISNHSEEEFMSKWPVLGAAFVCVVAFTLTVIAIRLYLR